MTTEPRLPAPDGSSDPWLHLEDVLGDDALAWVREQNAIAEGELDASGLSATLDGEILTILDSPEKIPMAERHGGFLYNFWTDADHVKGLLRRTTMQSYRTDAPEWDVLLDIDALNEAEGEDWVFHGSSMLRPAEGEQWTRALVELSHGGSDSSVTREFDLPTRSFVGEDEDGFVRPDAKGWVSWIDADTLFVSTEVGEGSMTSSGYPRQVRRWRRGTPLADAEVVFEASVTDMMAVGIHDDTPGFERDVIVRRTGFYDAEVSLLIKDELVRIEAPTDVEVMLQRELVVFTPRTDWTVGDTTWPGGSLLVAGLDHWLAGDRHLTSLFTPTPTVSLQGARFTRNYIVLVLMDDVVNRLEVLWCEGYDWNRAPLYPELTGSIGVRAMDAADSDEVWVSVTGFTTPTTLALGDLTPVAQMGVATDLEPLKALPTFFDASGLVVTQHFTTSDDGTRVPYFEIGRDGAGPGPTILYGYGGFEVPLTPSYLASAGKAWLERGGTYVLANIRGGGEYWPAWHQAALKQNRHKAYEDFSSVARDLVARGVTTREQLACWGGSNGGLLTGNMLAQYPDLFGAVVIQVPLLDMKRYSHLLAGASWMAEYGDPDTDDWQFIRAFSPYHLLREGVEYPPTFVLTSTKDDRVHPGHARKLVAALRSLGADVRSWENIEGGHGGAATNAQAARMQSLIHTFLWQTLG